VADIEAEVRSLLQSGRLEAAAVIIERKIDGARTCLPAHGFLASLFIKQGRLVEAEGIIARAVNLPGATADAYDGLAFALASMGHHERANKLYELAAKVGAPDSRHWYNLACSERNLGHLVEAEAACDKAISLDTKQYPTYLLRSELRVQSKCANHIEELKGTLARQAEDYRATIFLGYALGKELDDLGLFKEAFHWFATAAAARRSKLDYDILTDETKLAHIIRAYTPDVVPPTSRERCNVWSVDSSRYIFIFGLPRSGTTLVERILGGLAGVRSNGETDNFSRALMESCKGTGGVFARAVSANCIEVAARYAQQANSDKFGGHVIEKLPLNYLYAGAIATALPDAKLLLVTRAPLDSCFAMFRTLFGSGYPFSYSLTELGRYYAAYERLMRHWRLLLGERLHEIIYEDLVSEPRKLGASIAAYCGLQWRDAAIEIQNNMSASLTASASQIRRPIYGSSSGRWRHYHENLDPLIETLKTKGVDMPELL
jgi:tetratricopeptide (TPR) repeat protein